MTKYIKRYEVARSLIKLGTYDNMDEAKAKATNEGAIVYEVLYAVTSRGKKVQLESKRVF